MRHTSPILFGSTVCFGLLISGARAEEPVRLAPHRVVYDLSLAAGGSSKGVESARGRIAFDFTGDACEGYTLTFRQVTVLEGGEGGPKTSDLRTANHEAPDGRSFRFRNETETPNGARQKADGRAERRPDGVVVQLKEPRRDTVTIGEAIFPNAQMKEIVEAARAGRTTLSHRLYDGSDDGRKVYDTLALIGRAIPGGSSDGLEAAARQDGLARLTRWPVKMSYFTGGREAQTPVYTLSFELYENGISRALRLDYGDFALKGEMRSLELLPTKECSR